MSAQSVNCVGSNVAPSGSNWSYLSTHACELLLLLLLAHPVPLQLLHFLLKLIHKLLHPLLLHLQLLSLLHVQCCHGGLRCC
jgi:hypothetical protein